MKRTPHMAIVEELKSTLMKRTGGNPVDMFTVMDLLVGNMVVLMSHGHASVALLASDGHKEHVDTFIRLFFDMQEREQ